MGDNNIIRGRVTQRDGDRLVVAGEHDVQTSVVAPGDSRAVGDEALVAVRAAAVEVDLTRLAPRTARIRPTARSCSSSSSATS